MKITMDAAGRMVIPKSLRTAMGLTPNTPVDISFSDGRLIIEFAPLDAVVVERGGLKTLRPRQVEQAAATPEGLGPVGSGQAERTLSDPVSPPAPAPGVPELTDELVRDTLEAVRR
jgi:AbrB family looped-hinge helix DNA binding protein